MLARFVHRRHRRSVRSPGTALHGRAMVGGGLVHAHRAIGRCCRCPAVVRPGIVPMGLVGSCLAVSGVLPFDQKVRAIRRTQ